MKPFKLLALASILMLCATGAQAQMATTLSLKSSVTDGDGRITIGDVFDNAGASSGVLLGYRQGATTVLDAGIVQTIAARAGAYWDNPRGLRRIIVANGPETASADAPLLATIPNGQANAPIAAGWSQPSGPVAVKRAQLVAVTWTQNGLSLTLSGLAQKDGAIGDVIQIQNTSSKKLIDAVVTGPGAAVAGQAATQMRNQTFLSSR
ncbi:flagella basal body P-ring formation protein FlgA [Asticcacaulis benevestitus]|uniref:Flagella basal body P-ring formation protein FlgA SAF domain-containing protein n=1 Tax=Asticcacaulis benevestitus DSM 16100 = ATCC BAA-896 TaxID=1121022 RepID=V4Q0U8_9CAUL|nr:flagella basal body P-ring formation protein FlgA [Asticcacaulis benevestitus]ESQ91450.1 hypothetical protein ABENE_10580 [Asticcacaulis benevestitus DSM 16100 = ATCC BAA-896]